MQNLNKEIKTLLLEIETIKIQKMIVDQNLVDMKIKIIELLIQKKPINISIYLEPIMQIITKKICQNCHRQAEYQNIKGEIYCWTHSQNLE